jgi:hypothetical protein
MKLTEEIDAIRTLGLSAEQVLVVPRVLALIVALPLLVFVGDLIDRGPDAPRVLDIVHARCAAGDRIPVAIDTAWAHLFSGPDAHAPTLTLPPGFARQR